MFGADVVRFERLFGIIAERVGYARARGLRPAAGAAGGGGGAGAPACPSSPPRPSGRGSRGRRARFVAELGRSMVEPPRFTRALRDWAGDGPRRAYADEVAAIYARYRDGLERAGPRGPRAVRLAGPRRAAARARGAGAHAGVRLRLRRLHAARARRARDPGRPCGGRCGRLAAVRGRPRGLPGDRRHARAAGARWPSDAVVLDARRRALRRRSRAALHHLERGLFEPELAERPTAGDAVRLHSAAASGPRSSWWRPRCSSCCAAGTRPGDVAVVFREPGRYASLVEQVFDAYGIPYSIEARGPVRPHRRRPRAAGAAALRRARRQRRRPAGLAAHAGPARAARARRPARGGRPRGGRPRRRTQARRIWEATANRWQLDEIDRLARARGTGGRARGARPAAVPAVRRPVPAPGARSCDAAELDDAHAFEAARKRTRGAARAARLPALRRRARSTRRWPSCGCASARPAQPDRVQVAGPGSIRARRFEAVFVCGLQEGEFPRWRRPEPFLPDEERKEIAKASGLLLPMREDELERERYLFYVCASRAERLLVLSSRYCDEEGGPESPSFFVEDVRRPVRGPRRRARRRSLSDVTWEPERAPTTAEWERAVALRGPARRRPAPPGPLSDEGVLAELLARATRSRPARSRRFADCPVKWLVEKLLRPDALEPDPEQMVRGLLRAQGARADLPQASRADGLAAGDAGQPRRGRAHAARGAGRAQRRVPGLPGSDPRARGGAAARVRPPALPAPRGAERQPLRAGASSSSSSRTCRWRSGVSVSGRIDRVDTWDGHALVRDYKAGRASTATRSRAGATSACCRRRSTWWSWSGCTRAS